MRSLQLLFRLLIWPTLLITLCNVSLVLAKIDVKLPKTEGTVGKELTIPVTVSKLPGKSISGYTLSISYDASVLLITGVETKHTVSENAQIKQEHKTGSVDLSVTKLKHSSPGSATLIGLQTSLIQKGTSPLTFTNFSFSKENRKVKTKDGRVKVKAADDKNQPPKFTSQPVETVKANQTYHYTVKVTDPNGDPLTIVAEKLPNWLDLSDHGDGTATLEGTAPSAQEEEDDDDDAPEYKVKLEASDGDKTAKQTFSVKVTSNNSSGDDDNDGSGDDPDPDPTDNKDPVAKNDAGTLLEDTSLKVNLLTNDNDPDGNTLTVTSVQSPTKGQVSLGDNGVVTYMPSNNFYGTDEFSYTISDGQGGHSQADVAITVDPVNDPPQFTIQGDVNVSFNAGSQTLDQWARNISAGPANENNQDLDFNVSTDQAALFTQQPTINAETGQLTFEPTATARGNVELSVQLQDNGGTANGGDNTSPSKSFTIYIGQENQPPSFSTDPVTTAQVGASYQYIARASDPDEDELSVTASKLPDWLALSDTDNGSGTLRGTPSSNDFGHHEVTLQASDGIHTVNQTFVINVTQDDTAPTISTVTDQQTKVNTPLEVTGLTVKDDQAAVHALTIAAQSSNPSLLPSSNIVINKQENTHTLTLIPVINQTGTATITLTASDGQKEKQVTFVLEVMPDQTQPGLPEVINITDTLTLTIDGPSTQAFVLNWQEEIALQGPNQTYTWELAPSKAFASPLLQRSTGKAGYAQISYATIDSVLAALDLRPGQEVTLYQRVSRVGKGYVNTGSAYAISFARGWLDGEQPPDGFRLAQNYPNPFNPSTVIEYALPKKSSVRLTIYNPLGKVVAVLVDEVQTAGQHQVQWQAQGERSGPYFYQLETETYVESKKLLLLK